MDSLDVSACTGTVYQVRRNNEKWYSSYDRIFGKKGDTMQTDTEIFNSSELWGLEAASSRPALEEQIEMRGIQLSIIANAVRTTEILQADAETAGVGLSLLKPFYDELQGKYEVLAMEKQMLATKLDKIAQEDAP